MRQLRITEICSEYRKVKSMGQINQKHKRKRSLAVLLAVALVAVMAFSFGGQMVRADETFGLIVKGGGDSDLAELGNADMRIDLYKIADGTKDPSYDTWHWELTDDYASLEYDEKTFDNEQYTELAQAAAVIALDKGTEPVSVDASAGESAFSGLEPGLYVIIPRDNSQSDDADLSVEDGVVKTSVNTPEWTYTYSPAITAVPSKEAIDGSIGTAAEYGPWLKEVTVVLKPTITERLGSLEIVKTLRSFETKDPATFVFSVEAVKNGKNVYSDVVSMTFTGAGTDSRVIEDIPVGATVTVTEIYTGASYTVENTDPQQTTIAAEEVKSVEFTNDYDHTYHGGGGIENRFNYQTPESDTGEPWNFTQVVNGEVVE